MFPNFKILYEPEMFPNYEGIIFVGADKYLNYVKNLGIPYILVRKSAEYDLDNREVLLEVIFSKYGKAVPKYLKEIYQDIPDDEFMDAVKVYWVTGKWMIKEFKETNVYFELMDAIVYQADKVGKLAFKAIDEIGDKSLEYRLLNYMAKISNNQINLNSQYGRNQQMYYNQKYDKMKKAATKYLEKDVDNDELRLINFIKDLAQFVEKSEEKCRLFIYQSVDK